MKTCCATIDSRFRLTSRILQSLHGTVCDPNAAQEAAAGIFVHFLLIPHGNGDAVIARQKQVVMGVPFGVNGRLANVRGEHLPAVDQNLRKWIRKSCEDRERKECDQDSFGEVVKELFNIEYRVARYLL